MSSSYPIGGSSDRSQLLDEFLNNGRLPFVGRTDVIDRILSFAAGTLDARGLRIALVTGEGGIGKSRLVEELKGPLGRERILPVHVKFHPESNISITALLAHALDRATLDLGILKVHPEETLSSVVAAIRRCARLRPTMLLFEDIEQLQGESVNEFAMLTAAIADEALSMVCLSRPVELEARSILERWLVDEFALRQLEESDVEEAWRMTFSSPPSDVILDALMHATRGNALAVRAALRGAVHSGALGLNSAAGEWQLNVPAQSFATQLERNVRVVSQGLAAHLSQEEQQHASQLAVLGEVFSREAARLLIDDADAVLETLIFKGIIATAGTAVVAVNMRSSAVPPLSFSHTLMHQRLAERAVINPDRLVDLIAASPPIYSTLPFQFLLDKAGSVGSDCNGVRRAIAESLAVARILDSTAAWQKRVIPWGAATGLISRFVSEWDASVCADMQAMLLRYDLFLHSRNPLDQRQLVGRIMQFTEGQGSRPMSEARLVALGHRLKEEPVAADAIFTEVDRLLERYPDLTGEISYSYFLGLACEALVRGGDHQRLRRLEERLEEAYTIGTMDEEGRRQLLESHLELLLLFETQEELDRRFELLARLESESQWLAARVSFEKAELLFEIGRIAEAEVAAERSIQYSEERALREEQWQLRLIHLSILAASGASDEQVDAEAERLIDSIVEGRVGEYRRMIGERLSMIALLRNDAPRACRLAADLAGGYTGFPPAHQILLILADGHHLRLERLRFDRDLPAMAALERLTMMIRETTPVDIATVVALLRSILSTPILRLGDLMGVRAAIELTIALNATTSSTAAAGRRNGAERKGKGEKKSAEMDAGLRAAIHDGVTTILDWLGDPQRELEVVMTAVLESHGSYLSEEERSAWGEKVAAIHRRHSEQSTTTAGDDRVSITMLGAVEVTLPGGETQKISGLRLRTLLGLLVAEEMLREPLSYPEFCRLAAGTREYDKAARVATNGIIWRLRETFGHDVVDTSGEVPRLDPARVRVDLLEANRMLDEAMASLKSNVLVRAVVALRGALELAGGRVPFPTLYEDFFEALRSDFESRLQNSVTRVASDLIREADYESAADLLREGLATLPGDGEITDLLASALTLAGNRAEAESLRMREG